MPNGLITTKGGPLLASADEFQVTVHGRGGHASAPHSCVDPIPPAAAMVGAFQNILTRELDPSRSAVLTVAHFNAGTTTNIIPPSAFLEGTIRTFDEAVRTTIHDSIRRVADSTAATHRCSCTSEIVRGYPVTSNDPDQVGLTGEVATVLLGADQFVVAPEPIFAAEDFSYVLNRAPGAMAMLGVCPDDLSPDTAEPNHSNLMRVNESALYNGVGLYAAMAMAG